MDNEPKPSRISGNREEALSYIQNSIKNCDAMMGVINGKTVITANLGVAREQIWQLRTQLEFNKRSLSMGDKESLNKVQARMLRITEEDIKALYRFQGQTDNFDPVRVDSVVSQMRETEMEKHAQYKGRLQAVREACGDHSLNTYCLNEGNEAEETTTRPLWQPLDPHKYISGVNIIPIDIIIAAEQDLMAHANHVHSIAFADRKMEDLNWRLEDNLGVLEQLPIMPKEPV